ncbi:MAG TPA: hypothetical protein VEH31_17195 [Streptosporangiaceae bacterium]|nr:hypothetical protein [Streptosporangiaceae bacterium]
MIGIAAGPSQLPKFFPDGQAKTQGLCYINGPDSRPGTPGRTDPVPGVCETAQAAHLPAMDAVFAEAMGKAFAAAMDETGRKNARAVPQAAAPVTPGAGTDVVWQILGGAGRELDRGEILHAAKAAGLNRGTCSRQSAWRLRNCSPGCPTGGGSSARGTAPGVPAADGAQGLPTGAGGSGGPPGAAPEIRAHSIVGLQAHSPLPRRISPPEYASAQAVCRRRGDHVENSPGALWGG